MAKCSYCNEEVRVDRCAKHFVTKHIQEWSQKNKDIRRHCLINKIPLIWEGTVKVPTLIACLVCNEGCTKTQRSNPVEWIKTHKCNTPENFEPYIEHFTEPAIESEQEETIVCTLGPEETMWRNKYIELEKQCKDDVAKSKLEAHKATVELTQAKEVFEKALKPPPVDLVSKNIIIDLNSKLNSMTASYKKLQEAKTDPIKVQKLEDELETVYADNSDLYKKNQKLQSKLIDSNDLHKHTMGFIEEWIRELGRDNDIALRMAAYYDTVKFDEDDDDDDDDEEEQENKEEEELEDKEEEQPSIEIVEVPKVKVIRKVTKV